MTCLARQYSDQMWCKACNLTWDTNDEYPPKCKEIAMRTVGIVFTPDGQAYTYKTDLDLAVGDRVVVNTPNTGLQIVTVKEVHDTPQLDGGFDYTWIVQKIDFTNYKRQIEEDRNANPIRTRL